MNTTLWLETAMRPKGTARQRKATMRKRLQFRRRVLAGREYPQAELHLEPRFNGHFAVGDLVPSRPNRLWRVIAVVADVTP